MLQGDTKTVDIRRYLITKEDNSIIMKLNRIR